MTKAQREEWFTDKLLVDYYRWRLTLPQGSHRGSRYLGLITKHGGKRGGVGAMKQLLASPGNKRKTKEFGAEWFVLDPKFQRLFTAAEVKEAKSRLKEKSK
jgi:hypothetical protein